MLPEMTPEEAISTVDSLTGHITFDVPEDFKAKMAAFMLIVTDTFKSNCPCDVCQRTRDIFADLM